MNRGGWVPQLTPLSVWSSWMYAYLCALLLQAFPVCFFPAIQMEARGLSVSPRVQFYIWVTGCLHAHARACEHASARALLCHMFAST
jgi:hypothetical protein